MAPPKRARPPRALPVKHRFIVQHRCQWRPSEHAAAAGGEDSGALSGLQFGTEATRVVARLRGRKSQGLCRRGRDTQESTHGPWA